MSAWSSFSVGTVVPGEGALLVRPKFPTSPPKHGVISCHGSGSGAAHCIQPYGHQALQTLAMTDAGFTIFSGDHGGDTWGNSTAMARLDTAYAYLQTLPGVAPGKVALVSGSMGGLVSLNWAAAHPDKVSCIVSCIPVINPDDIVVNHRSLLGADCSVYVNAAYGGWSEAAYGATSNPRTIAATTTKLRGIPMLLWYGITDPLCVRSEIEGFAASPGMDVTLMPVPSGHEDATYVAVDVDQVAAFLSAHA